MWDDILKLAVEDIASVQYTGIELYGGERIFPICLGNKGDWSYLVLGELLTVNFFYVYTLSKPCLSFNVFIFILLEGLPTIAI